MKTTTQIKERPILFSTPMVQAILDGRKTMTRRVIKPQFEFDVNSQTIEKSNQWKKYDWVVKHQVVFEPGNERYEVDTLLKCPYGKPGDIIWCRELFYAYGHWQTNGTENGRQKWKFNDQTALGNWMYFDDFSEKLAMATRPNEGWYKRPSLFMPKYACRIFLEITDVRVERLKDLSEEDAVAEGVNPLWMSNSQLLTDGQLYQNYHQKGFFNEGMTAYGSFQTLWDKINGLDSWKSNPWVWVVSFKKIDMSKS